MGAVSESRTAGDIAALIDKRWPNRFDGIGLEGETVLGSDGLGLDSVEIAELLLMCEEESGIPLSEALLSGGPLTIDRVATHFWSEP